MNSTFNFADGSEGKIFAGKTAATNLEKAQEYGAVLTLPEIVRELSHPNSELNSKMPLWTCSKTALYYANDGFYVSHDDTLIGVEKLHSHRQAELRALHRGEHPSSRISMTLDEMDYAKKQADLVEVEELQTETLARLGRRYIVRISVPLLLQKRNCPSFYHLPAEYARLGRNQVFLALMGGEAKHYLRQLRAEEKEQFDLCYVWIPEAIRKAARREGKLSFKDLESSLVTINNTPKKVGILAGVIPDAPFIARKD